MTTPTPDPLAALRERHEEDERRGPATFWQPPGYGNSGLVAHEHRGILLAALAAVTEERDSVEAEWRRMSIVAADVLAERDDALARERALVEALHDLWELIGELHAGAAGVVAQHNDAIAAWQATLPTADDVLGILASRAASGEAET